MIFGRWAALFAGEPWLEAMEAMYSNGKVSPVAWDSGTSPEIAANKTNELFLLKNCLTI